MEQFGENTQDILYDPDKKTGWEIGAADKVEWQQGDDEPKLLTIKDVFRKQGIDLDSVPQDQIRRVGFHTGFIKDEDGEIQYTKPLLNGQFNVNDGQVNALNIEAVQIPENIKRRNRKIGHRVIAISSDYHIGFRGNNPTHDRRALEAYLEILHKANPDVLVNLGDLFDFAELSKYPPDSNDFVNTLQPTLQEAHNILAQQTHATPNAQERIVLAGNHDVRLENKLLNQSREHWGLKAVGEEYPAMSIPSLLKLDQIGHQWVGGYPANQYQYKDDMVFIHGSGGGAKPTDKLIQQYPDQNVFQGHLHHMESKYHTDRHGRKLGKFIIGMMGRIDGVLPSVHSGIDTLGNPVKRFENWQQGVAIVNDYGDGNYEVSQIPINEGKAYWQGYKFEGRIDIPHQD